MENSNEMNIRDIFQIIFKRKYFIILSTLLAALFSVSIALYLPNIYTSKGILMPSKNEESLSSRLSDLSSLASFGGFSLPDSSSSKSEEAKERIKSYEFFNSFFLPKIKIENLLAVKRWNQDNDQLIYDEKHFDSQTKKWISDKWVGFNDVSKNIIPSTQLAYEEYIKIISVSENRKTSFINISIYHKSPYGANKLLDIIINEINESMRAADEDQAKKSIVFLNKIIESTDIKTTKEIISTLLEKQMQTLMLTSAEKNYVFEIIDSPIVPEKKSRPSRARISILGTILGLLLSILIVFIQFFRLNYKP